MRRVIQPPLEKAQLFRLSSTSSIAYQPLPAAGTNSLPAAGSGAENSAAISAAHARGNTSIYTYEFIGSAAHGSAAKAARGKAS